MGFLAALYHLLNFFAPALLMALGLSVVARLVLPKTHQMTVWWLQVAINFAVGCAVLFGGLWWFGRDGKLVTYAALVLLGVSCQWILARGWRA